MRDKNLLCPIVGRLRSPPRPFLDSGGPKLHRFEVALFDDGGLAGEGEHTRAIIDEARLVAGAANRGKA